MQLPEELRLELKRLHDDAMRAKGRLEDALGIAQKALGLAPGTPVNLETGDIQSVETPMSDTELANIAENEAEEAPAAEAPVEAPVETPAEPAPEPAPADAPAEAPVEAAPSA